MCILHEDIVRQDQNNLLLLHYKMKMKKLWFFLLLSDDVLCSLMKFWVVIETVGTCFFILYICGLIWHFFCCWYLRVEALCMRRSWKAENRCTYCIMQIKCVLLKSYCELHNLKKSMLSIFQTSLSCYLLLYFLTWRHSFIQPLFFGFFRMIFNHLYSKQCDENNQRKFKVRSERAL